jgi:hypothetical protein
MGVGFAVANSSEQFPHAGWEPSNGKLAVMSGENYCRLPQTPSSTAVEDPRPELVA